MQSLPKKAPTRARSKKKAMNQARVEADQIMFDLIKGTAGSKKSGQNTHQNETFEAEPGTDKPEELKKERSKTAIRT